MKAIVYPAYGLPDVLRFEEIEKPTAGEHEVLIKVRAASVNPLDWHLMTGTPYFVRVLAGLFKPKDTRLGVDLAGHVEAVGSGVTQFKPGDEVFGTGEGAFAEYASASETKLALKLASLTFEQAAAVPVAATTALQGLRDKGLIRPKHKVLINGAAGGVGTFAVQIAKSFGAHVTGVCSTRNVSMVRSIGADEVIDYTLEDFTQSPQRYDLLFDTVGNRSLSACKRVMSPAGIHVVVGGPMAVVRTLLLSPFLGRKVVTFQASINKPDLLVLNALMESRKVTPVIDSCYQLREVREAIGYLGAGHARGKVVIAIGNDNQRISSSVSGRAC